MPSPNAAPDILTVTTYDRIVAASERILDSLGLPEPVIDEDMQDGDPLLLVARLPIERSDFAEVPTHTLTALEVSKPLGLLAVTAVWAYGVTYGMRGPSTQGVTLYKAPDPFGTVDNPFIKPYGAELTETYAQKVAEDLERLGHPLP